MPFSEKSLHIPASEPPLKLVAREKEMQALQRHLHEAIRGNGRTVLISGEAGIGKTRLATELMKYTETQKVMILLGRAVPHNLTPYLIFADAFEELFDESSELAKPRIAASKDRADELGIKQWILGTKTARHIQELELEPELSRERLFESVAHLLLKTSKRKSILIILEDLQWVDSASLGLLYYLARNLGSTRVLIIGTYREEELVGGEENKSGLLDTLRLLRREGLVEELLLDRLILSDVRELVTRVLGGLPPEGLPEILYRGTEGNPFFVIEAMRLLIQVGILSQRDGAWTLEKPITNEVPKKVYEVIARRLDKMLPADRDVIDCAAVIGDTFESHLLGSVLKLERSELLKRLNDLEKKYRLLNYDSDAYRFDHSMIREVIYGELGKELRVNYHREIAKNLLQTSEGELTQSYSLLAYHFTEAGLGERAAHYYRLAAEDLETVGEIGTAYLQAERGIEALKDARNLERGWLELVKCRLGTVLEEWEEARQSGKTALEIFHRDNVLIGEIQSLRQLGKIEYESPKGDPNAAERYLTEALNRSRSVSDPDLTAGIHILLAHLFAYRRGNLQTALQQISIVEGMAAAIRDPRKHRSLLMLKGWINLRLQGEYPAAEANFSRAMALGQKIHDPVTVASAKYGLTLSSYYQGHAAEALVGFEQFALDLKKLGLQSLAVESLCMAAECCLIEVDLERFRKVMASLDDPELHRGMSSRMIIVTPFRGIELLIQGEIHDALSKITEAVSLAKAQFAVEYTPFALSICGVVLGVLGREQEGTQCLDEAHKILENYGRQGIIFNLQVREAQLRKSLRAAMTS